MKLVNYLLILILVTCSCVKDSTKLTFDKIQGDWISESINTGFHERKFIFSFEDSLCTYLYAWGKYSKFQIVDSFLHIYDQQVVVYKDTFRLKNDYIFKILNISSDKIKLLPISNEAKSLIDKCCDYKIDTIIFSKVKPKNKVEPKSISFISSQCYGSCPSLFVNIDSSRNVSFFGLAFSELLGCYSGTMSSKDYAYIIKKVRNLPLDSIKEYYSADWTDDQTTFVKIEYNNKTIKTGVYGFDKEPIELRILIHKLLEVYKQIHLQKDTNCISNLKYKEMQEMIRVPEPINVMIKFKAPSVLDTIK